MGHLLKCDQFFFREFWAATLARLLAFRSDGSPKLRRYLLGVTRNRRSNARRNESAPWKPTDSATPSIEDSPAARRRRASFSRSVSTNIAGDEPKCSLQRRKNCRGERDARRAREPTDICFVGLLVIHVTS